MRILVLGASREDVAARSVAHALSLVHEVTLFDYERGFTPFKGSLFRLNSLYHLGLKATRLPTSHFSNQRLLKWIVGRRFDLIVVISINLVPPSVVAALRQSTGAIVIGWFTDAIVNLHGAEFIDAPYERVFFKDKMVVDRFRTVLASPRYEFLAQAFDPNIHRPAPSSLAPSGSDVDVATFGNSYPLRATLMAPLLACPDLRTAIYGIPSWMVDENLAAVYRPPVFGLRKSAAMRAAKIALNTNHFSELMGVNKRTFELAGMGAFQLTDGPTVEEYFEPETECAVFHGPRELVEKVRYYLEHPQKRQDIAQRGLTRAFRSHTYHHRLNEIFDRLPALSGVEKLPLPDAPPEATIGAPAPWQIGAQLDAVW